MMKFKETWLGSGIKVGGMLFLAGAESVTGELWNLQNPFDAHSFSIKSARFGLGVGGSGDLSLIFIFNTPNIYQLNGTYIRDWGINIDVGKGRVKELAKVGKALGTIRLALKVGNLRSKIKDVQDAMAVLHDTLVASSEPSVHVLDVPLAGIGLEVSASVSAGRLQIDSMELPKVPSRKRDLDKENGFKI